MTVVGCTGHQHLTPFTHRLIAASISEVLSNIEVDEISGLTSLAEGADQIFAFAMLAAGGSIEAVIPCEGYDRAFPSEASRATYRKLRQLSSSTIILPFGQPSADAFLAAGQRIVDKCDILIAVWNGESLGAKGGTEDVVRYARKQQKAMKIVWPPGSGRLEISSRFLDEG